ncbi:MAG: C40 family peptidase [Candidatus Krumholzibacteriia bacterium]
MRRIQNWKIPRNFKPRSRKGWIVPSAALLLLASCSSAPRYRPGPPEAAPPEPKRNEIVQFARTFVGSPYRMGGESRAGFDCSGLVMTVFRRFDIRLPRTSLDQSRVGTPIDRSHMKPADLVFFKTSGRRPVTHVGIYIGGGRFIHASTGARQVRIDELDNVYFKHRFVTAKRLLDS